MHRTKEQPASTERKTLHKPEREVSRRRVTSSKASEVAKRARVSLMTVSRVFSNPGAVSSETRQRVLAAATELGYESNHAARVLRTGQSNAVGLLMASHLSLRGGFHSEFLAAFESLASRGGLEVIISASDSDEPLWKRAQRLVASRTCGGLVVRYDILSEKEVGELSKVDAPLVLANYHRDLPLVKMGLHSVGFDNKEGTRSAVRHLVALGHKRIAYLSGTPGWMDSVDREEGFRAGMHEADLEVEESWIEPCNFAEGFDAAFERTAQILSRKVDGPTALVCASDEIAAGAMACIRRWGKMIPKDFSVTGFDDNRWCAYLSTPLTTIRHSGWALGEAVGTVLIDMMKGDKIIPAREVVLELQLIVRHSTGPAPDN